MARDIVEEILKPFATPTAFLGACPSYQTMVGSLISEIPVF
jgi:hypothetical protein